jgi:hypothetical protein
LKSTIPDRPDMTRTVNIMSGPNYRTDRTHSYGVSRCPGLIG